MGLRNIKSRIQAVSRNRKLEQFYHVFKNPCKVLDVGVLRLNTHNKRLAANHFLKTFRFEPTLYTGLAIEDMTGMSEAYPGCRFVQYDGKIFPFAHDNFDAVFSNAVIEHVGDFEDQLLFLNEMLRVGKEVFFTTPNKGFPIETHTGAFMLHWHDRLFFKWCEATNRHYNRRNLNLLGSNSLVKLLEASDAEDYRYRIIRNRFFGATMTYSVVCSAP